MKRFAILLCVMAVVSVGQALAAIDIEVRTSLAPNLYGTSVSNFATYQSNALNALENGLASYGDPALPSYYRQVPNGATISAYDDIVTGFTSWLGTTNPTGAFASEHGNRLTYGVSILGNGAQFSISQLSLVSNSTDATCFMRSSWSTGAVTPPGPVVLVGLLRQ